MMSASFDTKNASKHTAVQELKRDIKKMQTDGFSLL